MQNIGLYSGQLTLQGITLVLVDKSVKIVASTITAKSHVGGSGSNPVIVNSGDLSTWVGKFTCKVFNTIENQQKLKKVYDTSYLGNINGTFVCTDDPSGMAVWSLRNMGATKAIESQFSSDDPSIDLEFDGEIKLVTPN